MRARMLLRVGKWAAIVLACLLIAIQFIRPARTNPAVDESQTIQARMQLTPKVSGILERSCRDCHSNNTHWPWYSSVAPVSWFLVKDVNGGRKNLNLSEWGQYDQRRAARKLDQMCEEVKSGAMPLQSYTQIHRNAKLSSEDVKTLCDWANAEQARIASH